MGDSEFSMLKLIHVNAMVKRYRQLCGELKYMKKHAPDNSAVIIQLQGAIVALADAISICDPETNLIALKSLNYHPPQQLPKLALMRAILNALRISKSGLKLEDLINAVITKHHLNFDSVADKERFLVRVKRTTKRLARKTTILNGDLYCIK